jgi:hypothetical protein
MVNSRRLVRGYRFWYGTDSSPISISGPQPYKEPVIGGALNGHGDFGQIDANLTP